MLIARRTVLAGLGLAPAAALPAVAASETPEERIDRLSAELLETLQQRHGGQWEVYHRPGGLFAVSKYIK